MLELEGIGIRCCHPDCNLLQFIPFECKYCELKFCIDHVDEKLHECKPKPLNKSNTFSSNKKDSGEGNVVISHVNCTTKNCKKIGIKCRKCEKTLCSRHIYPSEHKCLGGASDIFPYNITQKKKLAIEPSGIGVVNSEIIRGVELPSNKSGKTLRKVMIKSKSIGDSKIPINSRVAIALFVDEEIKCRKLINNRLPICIWINGLKPIGWNLEYITEILGVLKNKKEGKLSAGSCELRLVSVNDSGEKKELKMNHESRSCINDGDTLYLVYGSK
ncbi:hypothetical protein FG379_001675 [Cryptosporidium bovis]|uniref:uncharacterized protein n=1 Tax=Cryptosporidium bovis TaxID=310047 RepID=UPI00351A6DC9|nr:hypothetical protein FG379_001675 [Cryptosporidium bovis]